MINRLVSILAPALLVFASVGTASAALQADPPAGVCFTTVPEYVAFYRGAYGYQYYANVPIAVRVCGYSPAQMTALNRQIVNGQVSLQHDAPSFQHVQATTYVVTLEQWRAMVQAGALAGIQPPPNVVVRGCTAEQMVQLRANRIPCGY